ncbi:hypothetical protein VP01_798g6 [Puccinia sorghi]|uniref:CRAL-TRIO domain-containing protein n=1 Tax=Puccinia sorghi TaxID=27349 RepID=A0A0L6UAR0_9BASI|nr:hypothetical protein VP01_798g6 [Puccinia sorghi]
MGRFTKKPVFSNWYFQGSLKMSTPVAAGLLGVKHAQRNLVKVVRVAGVQLPARPVFRGQTRTKSAVICNSDNITFTMTHHPKQSDQPKKHFPIFWKTMKHPSLTSSPLPIQSLDSLTVLQRSTYDFIVNTLSEPNFQLPSFAKPATAPTSSSTAKKDLLQDPPSPNKLTPAEKCFCSREAILRVCRATKWDRSRALKRLIDTLVWRREFKVDEIDPQELSHEAETGKQFTLGYDNHQRPILYMFPYRENTKPSINQIRLLVWYLERTIDLMPPGVETLTLIIDFGDSSKPRSSQITPLSIAKEALKILQTYYCERLAQAICINVPWVFWGFLKLLKPFLDPKTVEKVLFDPVVSEHVPAEQLIKESFNGTLDFRYDHEIYYKLLAELTASRKKKMLARYDRYGEGRVGMSEFVIRGGNRRRSVTTRELSEPWAQSSTHNRAEV